MATVKEALDNAIDETRDSAGFSGYNKIKSQKVYRSERTLYIKQLLRFLENVDEDLSILEVRQQLEELIPS